MNLDYFSCIFGNFIGLTDDQAGHLGHWKEIQAQKFRSPMRKSLQVDVAAIASAIPMRIEFAPIELISILWTAIRFATVEFNHAR
jgi:hypothetical protein